MACGLATSLPQRLPNSHLPSDYPGNSSGLGIGNGFPAGGMQQHYEDSMNEKVQSFLVLGSNRLVWLAETCSEANMDAAFRY